MIYLKKRGILAILLAAVMILGLAACGDRTEEIPSEEDFQEEPTGFTDLFLNPLAIPEQLKNILELPSLVPLVLEHDAINEDTIGWLQVPGTTVDEVVMYYDDSGEARRNDYYLRRNFEKKYSFDGSYFADYRCKFDGTADGLVRNTVIYGHSMDDDINGKLMSQLKKFDIRYNDNGEQFAKENPYIFFSLEDQDLAWEIFAVYDATIHLPYNNPNPTDEEFSTMISEATKRSIYIYDTEVTANDKILTLSTCTYKYDKNYPNDYRFVIMAKLVDPDEPLNPRATFQINDNPKEP